MSHHFDSELARQDPRLDISDVYLFRGTRGTVLVMDVDPMSSRHGFHPDGLYEFKVDLDGDAVEDLTFRFTFEEADAGRQRWTLRRLDGGAARDRDATGTVLLTGETNQVCETPDGTARAWAGEAADPFWIEGTVVTAVRTAISTGEAPALDGFDPDQATNLFAGTDVAAIVLEVAGTVLGTDSIGFWATTALPTDAGGWRQINRCAHPLLNTLFELEDRDAGVDFNATEPAEDRDRYGARIVRGASAVVAAVDPAADPAAHAERVRDLLLPDVLRYEVGTEAEFGTDRRNGRGLQECVAEVMFELVLGRPVRMGLDGSEVTPALRDEFPYLAPPLGDSVRPSG